MPRPRKGDRAIGPYEQPNGRWLVRFFDGDEIVTETYPSEGEAQEEADRYNREVVEERRTVSAALDRYELDLVDKGNAPESVGTTLARLRALLEADLDVATTELDGRRAGRAYQRYRTTPTRTGRPPAKTTHINVLSQAKTFGRWLVRGAWCRQNPFEGIEAVGYREAGKTQLTIDQSRALEKLCLMRARSDAAAVGVLMALYFGIRATEIVSRTARDLDDGGALLRVRRLKKRRHVEELFPVPTWFRPHLERLAGHQTGELFPGRDRTWLHRECRRLCLLAKVPPVGPHALRGSLGSSAREVVGLSEEALRRLYGHDSIEVQRRHYVDDGAQVRAEVAGRLEVLEGGRSG